MAVAVLKKEVGQPTKKVCPNCHIGNLLRNKNKSEWCSICNYHIRNGIVVDYDKIASSKPDVLSSTVSQNTVASILSTFKKRTDKVTA